MENLQEYYNRVEEAVRLAGIDPTLCRSENTEGQWNLSREDLEVWIDVLHIQQNQRTYLQIMCPIAVVPKDNREAFLNELLEVNYQMIDASFCVFDEGAYLKIMREIEKLAPEDILLAINRIGYYATVQDRDLKAKFNIEKIQHHD